MSRSYKKTPVLKAVVYKKGKNFSNRAIRRFKGSIPNGTAYKKVYPSWNIHEFTFYYPYQSFKKDKEAREKNDANGILRNFSYRERSDFWERYYYRK